MDAFGAEWKGMDTGMVTLEPHASTTWHVRLELFDPPQVSTDDLPGRSKLPDDNYRLAALVP
jgi:hypothetical protein